MRKILAVVLMLVCFLTACAQKPAETDKKTGPSTDVLVNPFEGLGAGMPIEEAKSVIGASFNETVVGPIKAGQSESRQSYEVYSCAYEVFSFDGVLSFFVPKNTEGVTEILWNGQTPEAATVHDSAISAFVAKLRYLYDSKYTFEENEILYKDEADKYKYKSYVWKDGDRVAISFEITPNYNNKKEKTDKLNLQIKFQ